MHTALQEMSSTLQPSEPFLCRLMTAGTTLGRRWHDHGTIVYRNTWLGPHIAGWQDGATKPPTVLYAEGNSSGPGHGGGPGHGERSRSQVQVQKTCQFWLLTGWLLTFWLLTVPSPSI